MPLSKKMAAIARAAGLSESRMIQARRLASIPKDEFDRLVDGPDGPAPIAQLEAYHRNPKGPEFRAKRRGFTFLVDELVALDPKLVADEAKSADVRRLSLWLDTVLKHKGVGVHTK